MPDSLASVRIYLAFITLITATRLASAGSRASDIELLLEDSKSSDAAKAHAATAQLLKLSTESAEAKFAFGRCYEHGWGVLQNFQCARKYYQDAINGNVLEASIPLARLFLTGEGGPKNVDRCLQLLKSAAEKGSPDAEYVMGWCHEYGILGAIEMPAATREARTVWLAAILAAPDLNRPPWIASEWGMQPIDGYRLTSQARQWYQKAAAKGRLDAAFILAFYAMTNGSGDPDSGEEYVSQILASDNPIDIDLLFGTIQMAPPIWPAKREEIIAVSKKYFPRLVELAKSGDLYAQIALALHGEALGGAISAEEKSKWAETVYSRQLKLAESGDAASQADVAHCLEYGQWVPKDESAAFRWYKKAAEAGLPLAQQALGKMYADGRGTSVDLAQAECWRKKADLQYFERSDTKK